MTIEPSLDRLKRLLTQTPADQLTEHDFECIEYLLALHHHERLKHPWLAEAYRVLASEAKIQAHQGRLI
jgi:hypothetical protein